MKSLLFILSLLFLTGCANKISTHEQVLEKTTKKENLNEPKIWSKIVDNGKVNTNWIKTFNDPIMLELVNESLKNNRDIRSLKIQVEKSDTLVKKAAAALKPTIGLSSQYKNRNTEALDEIYGGGIAIGWEADIWGRLELSKESARQSALATQSDYEYARQSLAASTAKAWVMTTTSKVQKEYAKNIVTLFEKELKIMQVKFEIGQVDRKSVYLAKSNLTSSKNAYSKASVSYENAQRSLELLLGRYPSALIKGTNELIDINTSIPVGIPSEILQRRPDLIAAEQRVAAAFYKQRESKLLRLPRFTFSIGATINNLTDAAADLVAGLFAPLYQGGAIEAQMEEATLIQRKSIEDYAQKALNAFNEVETYLSLEEKLLEQESYLKDIVLDNKKLLELTKISYEVGKTEYLDISQINNRLISSQISLIDISSKRIFNRINLHLSLGGGFESK